MNRLLKGGLAALLFFLSRTPAYAANLPLLDPNFSIVPVCPTGGPLSAGAILQFIQNIMNAMISVGVVVMVLVIAYAGFLFILTPTNPESRSKAKSVLGNAVIGLLIVLSAWIGVDFIMKLLYDGGGKFGPWNKILTVTDTSICIEAVEPSKIAGLPGLVDIGVNGVAIGTGANGSGGSSYGVGVAKGLCADSNTSCSVAVMKSEGLNDAQAQAMSCIAVTESAGGANKGASGTGALGLFQITGDNWAVAAFHKPPCSTSTSRLNDACNRQAAVLMFRNGGSSYQPWTGMCLSRGGCGKVSYGQYWNPNAVACVQKYDPGGRIK